jgi:hypothetical protein
MLIWNELGKKLKLFSSYHQTKINSYVCTRKMYAMLFRRVAVRVTIDSKFYIIRFKDHIGLRSSYISIHFWTKNYLISYRFVILWRNIWITIYYHPYNCKHNSTSYACVSQIKTEYDSHFNSCMHGCACYKYAHMFWNIGWIQISESGHLYHD